ncbi:hypothetical protein F4802DRAFT_66122 [Xylaria palmicola]|nr:hypothetical protein F4802DRAFT_66122 [Xylaria palmicola]
MSAGQPPGKTVPGETGPVLHELTRALTATMGGLFGIAVYNSLEIYIAIFRTFRRRRGAYFWSALCANTGIPLNSLFGVLRYFDIVAEGPMAIMVGFAWWMMITGQAAVLYSRLHLVMGDRRKLRWLLWMIASVFVLVEIPTATLFAFVSFKYNTVTPETTAFHAIEIMQLIVITIQECLLSGLYVYTSRSTLKPLEVIKGAEVRKLLRELIALFVLVVSLDIALIIVQFTGYFYIQTLFKAVVYGIKLKGEVFVLNNLVSLLAHPSSTSQQTDFHTDGPILDTTVDGSVTNTQRARYSHPTRRTSSTYTRGRFNSSGGGSVSTRSTNQSNGVRVPMKVLSV